MLAAAGTTIVCTCCFAHVGTWIANSDSVLLETACQQSQAVPSYGPIVGAGSLVASIVLACYSGAGACEELSSTSFVWPSMLLLVCAVCESSLDAALRDAWDLAQARCARSWVRNRTCRAQSFERFVRLLLLASCDFSRVVLIASLRVAENSGWKIRVFTVLHMGRGSPLLSSSMASIHAPIESGCDTFLASVHVDLHHWFKPRYRCPSFSAACMCPDLARFFGQVTLLVATHSPQMVVVTRQLQDHICFVEFAPERRPHTAPSHAVVPSLQVVSPRYLRMFGMASVRSVQLTAIEPSCVESDERPMKPD